MRPLLIPAFALSLATTACQNTHPNTVRTQQELAEALHQPEQGPSATSSHTNQAAELDYGYPGSARPEGDTGGTQKEGGPDDVSTDITQLPGGQTFLQLYQHVYRSIQDYINKAATVGNAYASVKTNSHDVYLDIDNNLVIETTSGNDAPPTGVEILHIDDAGNGYIYDAMTDKRCPFDADDLKEYTNVLIAIQQALTDAGSTTQHSSAADGAPGGK